MFDILIRLACLVKKNWKFVIFLLQLLDLPFPHLAQFGRSCLHVACLCGKSDMAGEYTPWELLHGCRLLGCVLLTERTVRPGLDGYSGRGPGAVSCIAYRLSFGVGVWVSGMSSKTLEQFPNAFPGVDPKHKRYLQDYGKNLT